MATENGRIGRRDFLKTSAGSAGLATAVPWVLRDYRAVGPAAGKPTVKICYIGSFTGYAAPYFGAPASFVCSRLRSYFDKHGLMIAGVRHKVEISYFDSQGSPANAVSEAELQIRSGAGLILVQDAGGVVTAVARFCRESRMPCVSTGYLWESWFESLGGKDGGSRAASTSWKWAYHFFWGLADAEAVYTDMWSALTTNKKVGGLWSRDQFGDLFASEMPAVLKKHGYDVFPGRFADGDPDIGSLAGTFKKDQAQILTGTPDLTDFQTFWKHAKTEGYQPVIATITYALDFAPAVNFIGARGTGLSGEVWWSPAFPWRSSITGQTAAELAAAFTSATKLEWSQAVGSTHALFEVARAALVRARSLARARADHALSALRVDIIAGPLDWRTGPVRNVSRTPLVGGQWQQTATSPRDLVIVANKTYPRIPLGGHLKPISYS